MSFPSDTSQEFADLQLALLAMKSPNERLNIAAQLSDDVYRASRKAIARVHPEFTGEKIDDLFIELHHGPELANAVRAYRKLQPCKTSQD